MTLDASIAPGLAVLGIEVAPAQRARMAAHLELVAKWNRVHNLTAVRETGQMVVLHLLDSLTLAPHLRGARTLLDVGSGAGFPEFPSPSRGPSLGDLARLLPN